MKSRKVLTILTSIALACTSITMPTFADEISGNAIVEEVSDDGESEAEIFGREVSENKDLEDEIEEVFKEEKTETEIDESSVSESEVVDSEEISENVVSEEAESEKVDSENEISSYGDSRNNGILCYDDDGVNVTITGLVDTDYSGSINIPSTIDGHSVTSIGDGAFHLCKELTSITIPNSVTDIGDNAFSCCDRLTSISIPSSVTSIGNDVFYLCIRLRKITNGSSVSLGLPSITGKYWIIEGDSTKKPITEVTNNTAVICNICEGVFRYVDNGTSVTITGLNDIDYAGEIDIPSTINEHPVISIRYLAFEYCERITKVSIPNSVTSIGNYAFDGCDCLTSISIPNSVTSIGDGAFGGCRELTSISIPNSVTSIGDSVFYSCESLTSISIPNGVTSIGEYAFYECSSLTSINIPNSVTSIDDKAFGYCSSLSSITIPSSVTSISSNALSDCSKLKEVVNLSLETVDLPEVATGKHWYNKNDESKTAITSIANGTALLCEPYAAPEKPAPEAQTNKPVQTGNTTVVVSTTTSGTATISKVTDKKSKSITLDKVTVDGVSYDVTTVAAKALRGTKATTLNLGPNITTVKKNALSGSKIKTIKLNAGTTKFEKGAFKNSKVTNIKIPKTVSKDKKAFKSFKKALKKAGYKGKVNGKKM